MDIDPLETVEDLQEDSAMHRRNARLNAMVAVTVAVLATFMGICRIKDDNIVQGMQQAQADKLDSWNFYQARNIRQDLALASAEQLKLARFAYLARPGPELHAYDDAIARFQASAEEQERKKADLKTQAEKAQKTYDALNFRDDQFDLSEAATAIAIALLAVTALTRLRWLYWLALVPSVFGIVMGLAGLIGLPIHPDALVRLLT